MKPVALSAGVGVNGNHRHGLVARQARIVFLQQIHHVPLSFQNGFHSHGNIFVDRHFRQPVVAGGARVIAGMAGDDPDRQFERGDRPQSAGGGVDHSGKGGANRVRRKRGGSEGDKRRREGRGESDGP